MRRIALTVRADAVEDVLDRLLPLLPQGVHPADVDDGVELAIYGGDVPGDRLETLAGDALLAIDEQDAPDDPRERRRRFGRTWEVGGRFVVRPPEAPESSGALPELVIDSPAGAFGTGAHPTTRMCLELLLELEPAGALADWGCGTGVLAIAAARLGWAPVAACDWEAASVAATRENAALNGAPGIAVTRADLRRGEGPWAPTVLANLVRPLLLEVAAGLTRPPGRMILSGLLREEADEVAAAFARHGLAERDRRHGGEWSALLLER